MSVPLKVCIVAGSFPLKQGGSRGGTTTYVEMLAKALLSRGVEVHVVLYAAETPSRSEPGLPVQLHVVVLPFVPYFSAAFPGVAEALALNRFLIRLDRHEHFDVVEGMNDEGWLLFVARTFRSRFWIRLLSSLLQHIQNKRQRMTWSRRFSVWLDGVTVRQSKNLVTHSACHASAMSQEYRVPMENIHIVPLAVSISTSPPAPGSSPASAHPRTLAYIGTLDQRKGIDVFLNAVPYVLSECPDTRFLIIGRDGGDSPGRSWQQWFAQAHLDSRMAGQVEFLGVVSDGELGKLWERISVMVVPSRYESFGLVVIEAFARGIPVLAARGGALPEIAKDGAALVAPDDPPALAAEAVRLLRDSELARRIAERGRALYREYYTLERFADNVLRVYGVKGQGAAVSAR